MVAASRSCAGKQLDEQESSGGGVIQYSLAEKQFTRSAKGAASLTGLLDRSWADLGEESISPLPSISDGTGSKIPSSSTDRPGSLSALARLSFDNSVDNL